MIKIKSKDINENLIKHYGVEIIDIQTTIDEEGNEHIVEIEGDFYYIKQIETGIEYEEAIDIIPCKYTYMVTDKKIEKEKIDV
jgi:hypothetical protein